MDLHGSFAGFPPSVISVCALILKFTSDYAAAVWRWLEEGMRTVGCEGKLGDVHRGVTADSSHILQTLPLY